MKANSPPCPSSSPLDGLAARQPAHAHHGRDDDRLEREQARDRAEQQRRRAHDFQRIDRHADRHEEQAHQQSAERVDGDLDLVPELGLREQQSRQQRAERHRQAGQPGERGDPERAEQRQRHEGVGLPARRHVPEDRPDDDAAQQVDQRDRGHGLAERDRHRREHRSVSGPPEQPDQDEHRHHGQVLEQQDRKAGLSDRRAQFAPRRQQLHDHRGRRERQRQADDQRRRERIAECGRDEADRGGADEHLCAARRERPATHRPQPLGRQLEADHEHQEHHADLGQHRHGIQVREHQPAQRRNLGREPTQPEGPTRIPTARNPSTLFTRYRCSSGTSTPASPRNSSVSRRWGIACTSSIPFMLPIRPFDPNVSSRLDTRGYRGD